MTRKRPGSLKRRLIGRLLGFQMSILLLFGFAFVGYLVLTDEGGVLVSPKFAEVAARSVTRGVDGRLHIVETREFAALRAANADLWFVARSDRGDTITFGEIPALYRPLARNLGSITFADIRDTKPPFQYLAIVRRASGPAGELTVLGKGSLFSATFVVLFLSNLMMIPVLGLLALITIVATPVIVRRALHGLAMIAEKAAGIDIDRRGARLPTDHLPVELVPLVEAMNGALRRLDDGYDRHQRFLVDAAHELRTPIAILQAKIDAAPDTELGRWLQSDVARLATLAEQMLDLQRMERHPPLRQTVDVAAIAREVTADLAPLVLVAGVEIEVDDLGGKTVCGDTAAIARVLANLIQNAVEHGGHRIIVRIAGRMIEVEDDGPGIPADERNRIFEPFHRLRPRATGAGLGLHLVRQVMTRHGGSVAAIEAPSGGTIIRLAFAAWTQG